MAGLGSSFAGTGVGCIDFIGRAYADGVAGVVQSLDGVLWERIRRHTPGAKAQCFGSSRVPRLKPGLPRCKSNDKEQGQGNSKSNNCSYGKRWIGLENFRLRVFRAVAEEMNFRKAAEVLHLSQPAVSQHVRALEEEAGVRLFDRARGEGHGSQISLTEAGRVLLGYANAAAETMVEAQRALAALNDEAVGELRLGASTTVAQYVLPRILGAFLRQYPQVKLSLVSGNTEKIVESVAEKRVEVGIIEGPAMRRGWKTGGVVGGGVGVVVKSDAGWGGGGVGG